MAQLGATRLIGVDWGSTNLRAFRFVGNGKLADTRSAPLGILSVKDGKFEPALRSVIDDWLTAAPDAVLILSGMIGSRQGWREAPYCRCPAGPDEVAAAMVDIALSDGRRAYILPGLDTHDSGAPDVMRGEETQIFGALAGKDGIVCTPGTHSKWVRVDQGRVTSFATYMTGELFDLLSKQSILGRLMEGTAFDEQAFDRGVMRGAEDGALSRAIFSTRTLGLFGEIPPTGLNSYLSGLLIGAEIAAALPNGASRKPVTVIAQNTLADLYQRALERRGYGCRQIDGAEASASGLWRLGQKLMEPA